MFGSMLLLIIGTTNPKLLLKKLIKGNKMYKKTTTTVEEFFDSSPAAPSVAPAARAINPKALKPVIRLDVPLMIRLLEYAKEEAKTDIELHEMVERMMELCEYGEVLEMDDYDEIVPPMEITTPTPEPMPLVPPTNS
jgi:hypothetical protein